MSEKERIRFMHNYCKEAEDQQSSGVSHNLARNIKPDLSEELIKYLVENCSEPLVIKNQLKWEILKWDLEDWCSVLNNEDLPCRCGKNVYSECPQWETNTSKKVLKISNFIELRNSKDPKEWVYFDYKYLKDWFINKQKLKKDITWKNFGYPNVGWQESTIWIGTKGAHTPCHVDTYGCNLVAQVLGRKLWCLFPPSEKLFPTRVPYEESTIFSELNIFSPQPNKFKDIQNCRKVILNPGDVLFVPHGWWHYVENLEFAISINTWLPTDQDEGKRLEESIVKMIMLQFERELSNDEKKFIIIEDNTTDIASHQNFKYNLNVTNFCLKSYQNFLETNRTQKEIPKDSIVYSVEEILQKFTNTVKIVSVLTQDEFFKFLEKQRNRFFDKEWINTEISNGSDNDETDKEMVSKVLSAILKTNVIDVIKQNLLNL